MPRTKRRTESLRERGIEAAITVLSEEGVPGLTAREIARRTTSSVAAVYEVFGDKAGLVREVFFEGFRMLGAALAEVPDSGDPVRDLYAIADAQRRFLLAHPVLGQVMFSQPFAAFDPTTAEAEPGARIRRLIVDRVRRAVEVGSISGDATDIAHVYVSLVQGLALAEASGRLGRAKSGADRRWQLALDSLFAGLAATAPRARGAGRPTAERGPRTSSAR